MMLGPQAALEDAANSQPTQLTGTYLFLLRKRFKEFSANIVAVEGFDMNNHAVDHIENQRPLCWFQF